VQSKALGHEAWLELNRLFESLDAFTKMFLNYKMQTLKMREGDNVTKHIHNFKSLLEQLSVTSAPISDEAILSLMRNMPLSFHNLISSMQRVPNLTLQSLITDLLQE
jgi:hypothetical protein